MTEITVRVLTSVLGSPRTLTTRPGRVPHILPAQLADEADQHEQFWCDRMDRSQQPSTNAMSVRKGSPIWDHAPPNPSASEIFGLYVVPMKQYARVLATRRGAAALASRDGHGSCTLGALIMAARSVSRCSGSARPASRRRRLMNRHHQRRRRRIAAVIVSPNQLVQRDPTGMDFRPGMNGSNKSPSDKTAMV